MKHKQWPKFFRKIKLFSVCFALFPIFTFDALPSHTNRFDWALLRIRCTSGIAQFRIFITYPHGTRCSLTAIRHHSHAHDTHVPFRLFLSFGCLFLSTFCRQPRNVLWWRPDRVLSTWIRFTVDTQRDGKKCSVSIGRCIIVYRWKSMCYVDRLSKCFGNTHVCLQLHRITDAFVYRDYFHFLVFDRPAASRVEPMSVAGRTQKCDN